MRLLPALSLLIFLPALADEPAGESVPAPASETEASHAAPLDDGSSALRQHLPASQQKQLQAGDEAFLALWLPANTGTARGTLVILPGEGEHADWPTVIGPLRRLLPDHGWNTLVPQLPGPVALDNLDQAQRTAALQTHAERVLARIEASVAEALGHDTGHNALLGHRSGAYWAVRYLGEQPRLENLLLVDPALPSGIDQPLEDEIAALDLAVGDFYHSDNPQARAAATLRLQASKRKERSDYRQVALPALPGNPEVGQQQLLRRVRGWLEQQAR